MRRIKQIRTRNSFHFVFYLCCLLQVVESFRVRSDIRYRFATTQISSVVRNVDAMAQEIGFDVTLPKNAFIMAFHMTIDGKRYDGQVKERKQAKQEYQAAVDRGQSAGHVRQVPRHANVFEVAVNVAAGSAVNFTLTYQNVLRRRRGIYEHEIHVNPGQPVQDFRIEVHIRENRPLKFVRTPALKTDFLLTNLVDDAGTNGFTVIERPSPETATIVYTPDRKEQGEDKGISARFVTQYDVEHAGISGDVLVVDGYFAHFMVPDNIPNILPKDIIFVLDVSGSMYGQKIRQLIVAMNTILSDLKPKDRFNIITFSSRTYKWKEGLVEVKENSINDAQEYVKAMQAGGMTNINDALLAALSEMKRRHDKERVGMIFFLTDGNPTAGEVNAEKIAKNVLNANKGKVAIFSLAFGEGADYDSLKSLSAQNLGFARKIYEASDAALQVSSLYNEISAVSIKDMSITYQNSSVDEFSLTDTEFPMVFNGTEIMVCGLWKEGEKTLKYKITGIESARQIDIIQQVDSVDVMIVSPEDKTDKIFTGPRDFSGLVERMWAYKTIRHLLKEKEKHGEDIEKVKELKQKILEMSLKYKFVTPLTSMVVTKPDKSETEVKEAKLSASQFKESARAQSAQPALYQPISKRGFDPVPVRSRASSSSIKRPFMVPRVFDHQNRGASNGQADPVRRNGSGKVTNSRQRSRSRKVTKAKKESSKVTSAVDAAKSLFPKRTRSMQSTLALVTLTKQNSSVAISDVAPYICMVPKRWKYFSVLLFSGWSNTRVMLKMCHRRKCPTKPSLFSLRFELGGDTTEVRLDNFQTWIYGPNPAFKFSKTSNNELHVSSSRVNATIKRTVSAGRTVTYKLGLTVDAAKKYSGILGRLASMPAGHLQRFSKRKAKKVCRDEGSAFSVLINRKMAKKFTLRRQRRAHKKRNGRSSSS